MLDLRNSYFIKVLLIGLCFHTQASAAASSCSSFVGTSYANTYKSVRLDEVKALVADKIDHFAEKLTLTEADLEPSFMMPDKDYMYQSDDPFTNRVCRHAMSLTLIELQMAGYNMNDWASFLTVYPKHEQEIFMKASEIADEAEYNRVMAETAFVKYMDGIDHAVVYSPKHDILIDLTYRQFLFGKISDDVFRSLPKVFVGSLSEYRNLVEPLLGKPAVDRLLTSAEADMFLISTEDLSKPTMLQFESGEKTPQDFKQSFEGDLNDQDFRELVDQGEADSADVDVENFLALDPESINFEDEIIDVPAITIDNIDSLTPLDSETE